MKQPIVLAVPMGDAAGIGPEIILKSLAQGQLSKKATILVVGDRELFKKTSQDCSVPFLFDAIVESDQECERALQGNFDTILYHLPLIDLKRFEYGKIDGMCGNGAYQAIVKATHLIQGGLASAMVTPPLHKESLRASGVPSIGHTEILGELTETPNPLTMFQTLTLNVFFMTRHLSLRQACDAVTYERVLESILESYRITETGNFDKSKPLAVASLNPHSGEHGLFGDEEGIAIEPAVKEAQRRNLNVIGPVSADSVFHLAKEGHYRAVLSLYHDQGHIATKTLDFAKTIAVTWNLPFLRTSVDHGTAFDIAGKGIASEVSMTEALLVAYRHLLLEKR